MEVVHMEQEAPVPKKQRRGWCCCGCLAAVGILVVMASASVLFGPSLLRAANIIEPKAEDLFSGSPDRIATQEVNDILATAGLRGVDALVIPISGSEGQIAVFTVDTAVTAGGIATAEEADIFLKDIMSQLSEANQASGLAIEHVAIDYIDESGESLLAITAPQQAVEAYANGSISRRDFLAQVDIDFTNLITADELRQLVEEGSR
jgi:hypothetical protein